MASKEELLEKNKDELVELARERELEGRSSMSKEELAEALADDSSSEGDSSEDAELREAVTEFEENFDAEEQVEEQYADSATQPSDPSVEASAAHHSAASQAENPGVQEGLSDSGKEALEEVGEDSVYAEESDLALDASGPLHFESPSQRVMTGAVNEAHAKEQEELLKNMPEDWTGDTTEAGFDKDGNAVVKPSDEEQAALQERRESRLSKKENLGEGDDREIMEVKQEDVIDFPPPRGEEAEEEGLRQQAAVEGAPFATTSVAGGQGRVFHQKSVFYTDGLGGPAEQNLERAYEIPELLQSNNPEVREAGDESLSEAAKEEKSEEEAKEAERVKSRDDDPSETSRNSE